MRTRSRWRLYLVPSLVAVSHLTSGYLHLSVTPPAADPVAELPQDQALVLRYHPLGSTIARYGMRMSGVTTTRVDAKPTRSTIVTEMDLSQKCESISSDVLRLTTTIDCGDIDPGYAPNSLHMRSGPVLSTMTNRGQILETSGFQGLDLRSMQLVLPAQPVSTGYAWEEPIPSSPNIPVPLLVRYSIASIRRFRNDVIVCIAASVRTNGAPALDGLSLAVRSDGKIWFSATRGQMLRNDVISAMHMRLRRVVSGGPQIIYTDMKMTMSMWTIPEVK